MFSTLRVPTEGSSAPQPEQERSAFEGMSLTQGEIDRILALRTRAQSIKADIDVEHINTSADLVRTFEDALARAKIFGEIMRPAPNKV